jgi:hypothetical protein
MAMKTLGIILAGLTGGVLVIAVIMLAGSGWETPGTYTGISNAAHQVTDTTHCYAFQTGCQNTGYSTGGSDNSGAGLAGSTPLTSTP